MRIAVAVSLALVLSVAAPAVAQTTATLVGVVHDATGGALSGVQVTARHVETGAVRRVDTGTDGRFAFTGLPVGEY